MKNLTLGLTVGMCLGLGALVANAQPPGGGGFRGFPPDGLMLLNQDSVKAELKLTGEQSEKLEDLAENRRESFRAFRELSREEQRTKMEAQRKESRAKIAEILNKEQLDRFQQITLQQRGAWAIDEPEVASALGLTPEQIAGAKKIKDEAQEQMRELGRGGNREEGREKFEALRKSNGEKLQALLTAAQQEQWRTLQGAPFTGEIRRPEFRGGGREGRGGRPPRST